jgi:hypothetical protein
MTRFLLVHLLGIFGLSKREIVNVITEAITPLFSTDWVQHEVVGSGEVRSQYFNIWLNVKEPTSKVRGGDFFSSFLD